jgi:SM-20-related protein
MLKLSKLADAQLQRQPFEYLVVDDFLEQDCQRAVVDDFPHISRSGSFPLFALKYGPAFGRLVSELFGKDFEKAVGEKFSMDLSQYPTMLTVRGRCESSDGKIHTDSKDKVITVLLYLNHEWDSMGGRLRLLRSKDMEDCAVEVPPTIGSLIVFKRCDHSWHGHKPFEGRRMSLQMCWIKSTGYMHRERLRHGVSSLVKQVLGKSRGWG